jgi:hypothetical protein
MKTEETTEILPLETLLSIRTTAGGETGVKGSGVKHNYAISKAAYLYLASRIFDYCVAKSKPKNATSGGSVSGTLHAYGVKLEKVEASGINPFPKNGEVFTETHADRWLEAMAFVKPREAGTRKTAKEVLMDAILATLTVPGITWETLADLPTYKGITLEDVEAYKAELEAE